MISDREAVRWEPAGSGTTTGKIRGVRRNLPPCRFAPIIVREPEKGILLSPDRKRGADYGEKLDGDISDSADRGSLHVHSDQRDQIRAHRSVDRGAGGSAAWPEEICKEVRKLYASGLTVSEIAPQIGKSEEAVRKKMKQMGYNRIRVRRRNAGPRKWTPDKIAIIRAMAAEGKCITDIAEEFGVKYDTIRAVMREHGIVCKYRNINPTYWTPDEKVALRKMREAGIPAKDIGKVLDKSVGAVYKQVNKQGLKRTRK